MSTQIGVLSLNGKGGQNLFLYDDALVRASVGIALAASIAFDDAESLPEARSSMVGEAVMAGFTGKLGRYLSLAPEQIAAESNKNTLIWTRDITSALLTKGRWPTVGLRKLDITLANGKSINWQWAGNGATRPVNYDHTSIELLEKALGDLLINELPEPKRKPKD